MFESTCYLDSGCFLFAHRKRSDGIMITRLEALYEDVEKAGILYFNTDTTKITAMTLRQDNEYAIAINERAYGSNAERLVTLAHEKGHCDTGAVYNLNTPLITRGYCERRANRWAVQNLMPLDELIGAFESGCANVFELAEFFEVTEDFMRFALELYEQDIKRIYQEKHGK